jgi:hypothetical protein
MRVAGVVDVKGRGLATEVAVWDKEVVVEAAAVDI